MNWNPFRNFWPVREPGSPGAVHPQGTRSGAVSMLPHRVTLYRRPAFWSPTQHYVRREYVVTPQIQPGTAIPYTLFHPTYIPGLQGWQGVLATNQMVAWSRHSFADFDAIGGLARHPVTRPNTWAPVAGARPRSGRVWQQPRPDYTPTIINPGVR